MMHPVPTSTPTQELATIRLGTDIHVWIAEQRDREIPYRTIARRLRDLTDGKTDVTDAAIRKWHIRYVEELFVERLEQEVEGVA